MATNPVRALAEQLTELCWRFQPLFGRPEANRHARSYVNGLLWLKGRKSVEPMALTMTPGVDGQPRSLKEVRAMQRFLTNSPWSSAAVQREIQAVFAEKLAPAADELGTVLVVDESGFTKQGEHSVGVARQYNGRLGKVDNCQVGVFVTGLTPAGSAILEHQIYLPEDWAGDQARRRETKIPDEIVFQTKQQISLELIKRILSNGLLKPSWVMADEGYGRDGDWLDGVAALGLRYLAEIPKNTTVWVTDPSEWMGDDPRPRRATARVQEESLWQVEQLAALLTPRDWRLIKLRDGAKGPLVFEFAWFRVWASRDRHVGPPIWILVRRSLGKQPVYKYYASNAEAETPPERLAKATGCRYSVEKVFEDGKGDLGMADYEARAWTSWHHHMSLVALAHLFLTLTRRDEQQHEPELTLEMALKLVRQGLSIPDLAVDDAEHIINYHLERNRIARNSHRKTWLRDHPAAAKELSL